MEKLLFSFEDLDPGALGAEDAREQAASNLAFSFDDLDPDFGPIPGNGSIPTPTPADVAEKLPDWTQIPEPEIPAAPAEPEEPVEDIRARGAWDRLPSGEQESALTDWFSQWRDHGKEPAPWQKLLLNQTHVWSGSDAPQPETQFTNDMLFPVPPVTDGVGLSDERFQPFEREESLSWQNRAREAISGWLSGLRNIQLPWPRRGAEQPERRPLYQALADLIKKYTPQRRPRAEQGSSPVVKLRDRLSRVHVSKEQAGQFLVSYGPEMVAGLLGLTLGATTSGITTEAAATGVFAREVAAVGVFALSGAALLIGDERGPEVIPQAEHVWERPVRGIQRLCSQKAVRRGLKIAAAASGGYAVGGIGRTLVDEFRMISDFTHAPATPTLTVPTEVAQQARDMAARIGDTRGEAIQDFREGAIRTQQFLTQQEAAVEQAAQTLLNQASISLTEPTKSVADQVMADPTLHNLIVQASGAEAQVRQAAEQAVQDPNVQQLFANAQEALKHAQDAATKAANTTGFDTANQYKDAAQQALAQAQSAFDTAKQAALDAATNAANQAVAAAQAVAQHDALRSTTEAAAQAPAQILGKNLATGTVLGNEFNFVEHLRNIRHVSSAANALKNFAAGLGQAQPFTKIGSESIVNLADRNVAAWVASQVDQVVGLDKSTLNPLQKVLWEIGILARHATPADLAEIAKGYAATIVP